MRSDGQSFWNEGIARWGSSVLTIDVETHK